MKAEKTIRRIKRGIEDEKKEIEDNFKDLKKEEEISRTQMTYFNGIQKGLEVAIDKVDFMEAVERKLVSKRKKRDKND